MSIPPKLAIVVPCFNETLVIEHTYQTLLSKLSKMIGDGLIASESMLVFVDDGSSDETWTKLENLTFTPPRISLKSLSNKSLLKR